MVHPLTLGTIGYLTRAFIRNMAIEIERKFLVHSALFTPPEDGKYIKQGYLSVEPSRTVRVRISGSDAWLTVKGKSVGASRLEFEYPIPLEEAQILLDSLCEQIIEKIRYRIPQGSLCWEVDVFLGQNAPLLLAEIELPSEHTQVDLPAWVAQEVTEDPRYFNSRLGQNPYQSWS